MKILTDKKLIHDFLTRGVEAVYPTKDALRKKLESGERLRIYQGFDPTGKFLHVGHAMGIRALRILQKLGHEVIFLVGDYTAKVGDPDKTDQRIMLSDKAIEENMSGWKKQASQLIDFNGENAVQFKHNYEWLSKLTLNETIKLMSHMTVQRMLERDMFERRIKEGNPIGIHEFIYPLMQGYDAVAMKVDMEIGGADQTFNMLTGRSIVKSYLGKEKFVRANKMMDAPDGRTMSKTKGNGINLGDTSEDMYGKAMSYPDSAIIMGFELLTNVPMEDIKQIQKELDQGLNQMHFKKQMAFEILKTIRGEKEAIKGQKHFEQTVQKKEIPNNIKTFQVGTKNVINGKINILDLLLQSNLVVSKGEAKRLIISNGIKINGNTVNDINNEINLNKEFILQRGKRQFIKIKI